MSYGSAALGSTSIGGAVASGNGVLFDRGEALVRGVYRRSLEYLGSAEFFQIEGRSDVGYNGRTLQIFSSNDPSETPQLQVISGVDDETFYVQSIIGAARFITVDLHLVDPWPVSPPRFIEVAVTGSEYFQ